MNQIKFGTDGWRAIIADDFTVENLMRVSKATADWLLESHKNPLVVIGHDCRFGGRLFSETVAKVMAEHNIRIYLADGFVSTPMVSYGTMKLKANAGIVITASHNPSEYNGFKVKAHFGGPALPEMISRIEALIPGRFSCKINLNKAKSKGLVQPIELEKMYCEHASQSFNMDAIKNSKQKFAYDAMFGAGQNVIKKLLPEIKMLHCEYNPSFKGQAPEPIHRNLSEFSNLIKNAGNISSGLATDGDADRIGMYDGIGNFIDSHHIILLLINYLHKHKRLKGKVITTFSCTNKIAKLCKMYGLEHIITKIGFKYICEYMSKPEENVLLGGEESGGIAISGHIPERDGIWMGLIIWEYMAITGNSLHQLIQEIYDVVGEFKVERNDLHIDEESKQRIIKECKSGHYKSFGKYKVVKIEQTDGYKFHFNEDEWVMIRPSGTEPVLRTYAESTTSQKAFDILQATSDSILKNETVKV